MVATDKYDHARQAVEYLASEETKGARHIGKKNQRLQLSCAEAIEREQAEGEDSVMAIEKRRWWQVEENSRSSAAYTASSTASVTASSARKSCRKLCRRAHTAKYTAL